MSPRAQRARAVVPVVLAGLVLAGCASAGAPQHAGTSAPVASAATSSGAGEGSSPAVAGPVLPSAAPVTTPANAVSAWYFGYGQRALNTIVADMASFEKDAKANHVQSALGDLRSLSSDIATAQAGPPIPVAGLEQTWSSALTDLAQGTSLGTTSMKDQAPAAIQSAVSEFDAGNIQIQDLAKGMEPYLLS